MARLRPTAADLGARIPPMNARATPRGDTGRWQRPRKDGPEQRAPQRNLGHLKDHRAAVPNDPGADLDQPVPQRGQWPVLDILRHSQRAQEVRYFRPLWAPLASLRPGDAVVAAIASAAGLGCDSGPGRRSVPPLATRQGRPGDCHSKSFHLRRNPPCLVCGLPKCIVQESWRR